jgi:TetR/AcrR family transcriptional regulator, cholesterol catabolism regulator
MMAARPKEGESYSSPAMQARRERILEETRRLIAEQGVAGFSLRELCRRADVAKQTLYYAFQSKEGLIAAAILDYFEEYERRIPYQARLGSLERLIERMVAIGDRNLTIPHYVAAITSFYYSQSASPELWRTLHGITTLPQRPYVEQLRKARQLQLWVDPEQLIDALDGQRLGIANEWVQGRIADSDMIDRMVSSVLTYLLGSVRGAARGHIEDVMSRVAAQGAAAYVAFLHDAAPAPE